MNSAVWQALDLDLQARHAASLFRQRQTIASTPDTSISIVNGRPLRNFCSNDYLGLSHHPRVIEAFTQAAARFGVGAGASHLVCGHTEEHHALEQEFARQTGRESALLFSSGYMANLGILTTLLSNKDLVLEDRLNHASLLDGGLYSGARFQRFAHNNLEQLEQKLTSFDSGRKLVCVDGVFSMDGDMADLPAIARLCSQNDALLMVDDAHGFGVLGKTGLGTCEHFGLSSQDVPVLMCTLGKALGTFGAMVAGPAILIESLVQHARTYIYTTALPPAVAAATRVSLQIVAEEPERRQHLADLVNVFRRGATELGLPLLDSFSPIQPLVLGSETEALRWQQNLASKGFWVSAIRPPTVPKGTSRLRITFSASHGQQDVSDLLQALKECLA